MIDAADLAVVVIRALDREWVRREAGMSVELYDLRCYLERLVSAPLSAPSTPGDVPATLSTKEAAALLGVSDRTIRRKIARGQLVAQLNRENTWELPLNQNPSLTSSSAASPTP
jgi:Helix-turn-helix domain